MSQDMPADHITRKVALLTLPGADKVTVRRDLEFSGADGNGLTMDLYDPPDAAPDAPTPAVVLVSGYPDPGMQRVLGCRFKEMGSSVSWGRLIAASGMVAVTYTNQQPAADLDALVAHLRRHATALGIDAERIGVWACSGNAALALSTLLASAPCRPSCGALLYGCLLDLDGSTATAVMAKQFGFANPCAGKSVDDLAGDVPLLLARAGRDEMPGLNETLDRFVSRALVANRPLTVVNVPDAPHAFDLLHDSGSTRRAIRQVLDFLRIHLNGLAPAEGAGVRKSR